MTDDTYAKLMSSIVLSSVWVEPHATFKVWIALLATKDKDGIVRGSIPGLANLCGVTLAECDTAIGTFLAPDPYSRTKDFEGRRIEVVEGGWRVLNHDFYRDAESKARRREYKANWMADKRAEEKAARENVDAGTVHSGQPEDKSGPIQIQITDTKEAKSTPLPPAEAEPTAPAPAGEVPGAPAYTAIFERFWTAYPTPHKGSKKKAFGLWQRGRLAAAAATLIEDVTRRGAQHGEWRRESGRYIPHVTTYLNARTWEEPIVAVARGNGGGRDRAAVEDGNRQAADAFAGEDE